MCTCGFFTFTLKYSCLVISDDINQHYDDVIFISGWYDVNRGRHGNRILIIFCTCTCLGLRGQKLSGEHKSVIMEDMDVADLVDMAKLAEHAERFEGRS